MQGMVAVHGYGNAIRMSIRCWQCRDSVSPFSECGGSCLGLSGVLNAVVIMPLGTKCAAG
jgi:hypothetical protein